MTLRKISLLALVTLLIYGCASTPPPKPQPKPPPEGISYEKTMFIVIKSIPSGADVYTVETSSEGNRRSCKGGRWF